MSEPKPQCRPLWYDSWDHLLADLDRIERAAGAGAIRLAGNWTVGQNCEHIARVIGWSFDGFPMRPLPAPARLAFRLAMKKRMLTKGFPKGLNPKGRFRQMTEAATISDADGLRLLREQIARFQRGEVARQPSPMLGALTPEEIVRIHLNHAAHHLAHVLPDAPGP